MVLMNQKRFNIRVYGIWIHENKLLINEELIRGKLITKFPGGGLEFGEGTIDGLKREWKEELGLDIEVLDHFYTTDFFQASAYDDSQVISIYYLVRGFEVPIQIVNYVEQERTFWKELSGISGDTFSLPIDKTVGQMLLDKYNGGTL
jgi:ADP-ribose pyrophosphatase YjhB (NUDIX family)